MTEEQRKQCEEIMDRFSNYCKFYFDGRKHVEYLIHIFEELNEVFNNITNGEAVRILFTANIPDELKENFKNPYVPNGLKEKGGFMYNLLYFTGSFSDYKNNKALDWLIENYFDNENKNKEIE